MKIEKKLTRDDLYEDALSTMSMGKDLLSSIIADHFEWKEMPEDFSLPAYYETIGRKIWAANELINSAFCILEVAFMNHSSNEYYNARAKLIAEYINTAEESPANQTKNSAVYM